MFSVVDKTSPDVSLLFGVPQASVLGPNNYCMYTKPVGEIIKRYNIKYHCYANDTHVINGMIFHLQLKLVLQT